jgi:CubicO group peptidase (beta-lactamase class C family)
MQVEQRVELAARVDAAIEAALGSRVVGCVIMIDQGGERIYTRAAGLSDREANLPMREDTIFRLASVAKPIVATAVLRLYELGQIALDDPVTRFLPDGTRRTRRSLRQGDRAT